MSESNYWMRPVGRRAALRGSLLAGAGLAGAALIGCGTDDDPAAPGAPATPGPTDDVDDGEPQAGGQLTTYLSGNPRSLDPHFDTFPFNTIPMRSVYNTLLHYTLDAQTIEPELATALPEQPDEVTYVFTLNQGVRFHDVAPANGRELTSEDVKYSIERQMTDEPGVFQHAYYFLGHVTDIQTPDDHTVSFTTGEPYAPMMSYLADPWTMIINRETVEEHGDLTSHAVGTGPMIFEEWLPDQHIKVRKNEDYWEEGRPYLDGIEWLIVTDPDTLATMYVDRRIQTLITGFDQLDRVRNAREADSQYSVGPSQFWRQFRMQPTMEDQPYREPFDDVRVRQAIAQAIDKQQVLDLVHSGDGMLAVGPILPQWEYWALTEELAPFDLESSRALLDAAGNPSISGPMIWAQSSTADQIGEVIREQLAEIDVRTSLEPMELAAYYNLTYAYDYTFSHHVPLNSPDPDENLSSYFGRHSTFFKHYNPEIFDIIDRQARTVDREERREIVMDAQRMIVEDYPMRFMFTTNFHYFISDEVKGWRYPVNLYESHLGRMAWLEQ